MSYNGWKNYETWNVARWIGNDEGLYHSVSIHVPDYRTFVEWLEPTYGTEESMCYQTPDGVAWNDSGLDIDALDEMIAEL